MHSSTLQLKHLCLGFIFAGCLAASIVAAPLGTAFTYHGQLRESGSPVNGLCDFQFSLWDADTNGLLIGTTQTVSNVSVSNGLFTAELDFGAGAFNGDARWLEIGVRTNGGSGFTILSPRQELMPTPYAIHAGSAGTANAASGLLGPLPASQLAGTYSNAVTINNPANRFSGDGSGLSNLSLAALGVSGAMTVKSNAPFTLASLLAVGDYPYSVTAAEVSGDGYVDLICANAFANTLSVLTNDRTGGFALASSPGVGQYPAHVIAADLNEDGRLELISANHYGCHLSVLTNDGCGRFAVAYATGGGENCSWPNWVTAVDVNGDGHLDLASANSGAVGCLNTLRVMTNTGHGGFVQSCDVDVGGEGPVSIAALDVNEDSRMDVVTANYYTGNLSVLTNDGYGGFTVVSLLAPGGKVGPLTTADVNEDGRQDLICTTSMDRLAAYTNDGSGGFALAFYLPVPKPSFVIAADVNSDGSPDLICANSGSAALSVLTNDGGGGFQLAAFPAVGSNPISVAVADINGDGRLDLVSANAADDTLSLLLQVAPVTFSGDFIGNAWGNFSGTFTGDGAGLTNLSPGNLTGTIADGQLSTNVALRNVSQVFSGANTFTNSANTFVGSFSGNGGGLNNLSVGWSSITGIPAGFADGVDNDTTYAAGAGLTLAGTTFSVSFVGNGASSTVARSDHNHDLTYWKTGGNSGTTPGTDFLGTTDDQPLELRVNNTRALRLVWNADSPILTGGHPVNLASGRGAVICGGGEDGAPNTAASMFSFLGGGLGNAMEGGANLSTLAGGELNTIQSGAYGASIGGGAVNSVLTDARFATIPGGIHNTVGASYAMAAGRRAKALQAGAFVWADSTDADFSSTSSNQFLIRAAGGVGIGTNNPSTALHVAGAVRATAFQGDGAALTSLAASNLTGTIPEARLSTNVALRNTSQILSGANSFTNSANSFVGSFSGNGSGLSNLSVGWSGLTGIPAGFADGVDNDTTYSAGVGLTLVSTTFNVSFGGNGTSSTVARSDHDHDLTYWKTGGNSGTTPGTDFLGTVDNHPLVLGVNDTSGWRLEPGGSNSVNVIGGWGGNSVAPGLAGATIAGGGAGDYSGVVFTNRVEAHFGTIGGGRHNAVKLGAQSSTIAGGHRNTIQPSAYESSIGGGYWNTIQTNAHSSVIGGGQENTIEVDASYSTIGGGVFNKVQTNASMGTIAGGGWNTIHSGAYYSVVDGGRHNSVAGDAFEAAIGGGGWNMIQTNAADSTIGGGYYNTILADAQYAAIPGGRYNSAASYALAAGNRAKANHQGAFVWADSTEADFGSTALNQFLVRASGGMGIGINNPASALHVAGVVTAAGFSGSGAGLTGLSAGSLSGNVTNTLTFTPTSGAPFAVGNNNVVTNLNADSLDGLDASAFWKLGGNAGTTAGTHFLGTTDAQPLELRAGNLRGLWLQSAPDSWGTYGVNLVGGSVSNSVADGFGGVTIFGGSTNAPNHVEGNYATISGGRGNTIGLGAQWATISGGRGNLIETRGEDAVIGGGSWNSVGPFAYRATIGGGQDNEIEQDALGATIAGGLANLVESGSESAAIGGGTLNWARGNHAFIGGGYANRALDDCAAIGGGFAGTASSPGSTVGGGSNNQASAACAFVGGGSGNAATAEFAAVAGGIANWADGLSAVIAGGYWNTASGESATIGGGDTNLADHLYATVGGGAQNSATNNYATVGGGFRNAAGGDKSAVCGGWNNLANGANSFVGGGQFNRATNAWSTVSGGQGCAAYGSYATVLGGHLNYAVGSYSLAGGNRAKANHQGSFVWGDSSNADVESSTNDEFTVRASGGAHFFSNTNLTSGVTLAAGGGSWSTVSDRAAKRDFQATDAREILGRLVAMPIQTWSYKSQDPSIRHIGPVAQDFAAAFKVGEDNRHITTTDADGVALAAIQGLNELMKEKDGRIEALEQTVAELKAMVIGLLGKSNGGGQ